MCMCLLMYVDVLRFISVSCPFVWFFPPLLFSVFLSVLVFFVSIYLISHIIFVVLVVNIFYASYKN